MGKPAKLWKTYIKKPAAVKSFKPIKIIKGKWLERFLNHRMEKSSSLPVRLVRIARKIGDIAKRVSAPPIKLL